MKIIKSLQASLLNKTFQYNHKHFFVLSSLWGFRLDSGEAVLEQDLWQAIGESLGKNTLLDQAMPKDQAEYLVFGSAQSLQERPTGQLDVVVEFAGLKKHLVVYGDRYWKGAGAFSYPSEPTPFTTMPIDYQHAFGGETEHYNTEGLGCAEIEKNNICLHWLANIEHANHPVTSKANDYQPASFLPLDQSWPMQQALCGTYDDEYLQNHMPGLAPDIDWRFFNVAAQDQRFDGYLHGDEPFAISGMHHQKGLLKGVLPKVKPRGFIVRKPHEKIEAIELIDQYSPPDITQFEELEFKLDTVLFFPNDNLGVVIHRGSTQVSHPQGQDIEGLLLAHQGLTEKDKPQQFYFDDYCNRTNPALSYKYLLDSRSLLPINIQCGFQAFQENIPNEASLADNMSTFAGGQKDAAELKAAQAIEQQEQELRQLGKNDEAEQLKNATGAKKNSQPLPAEAVKLAAIADKILPGAKDGKITAQNIDLTSLNMDAMEDMNNAMVDMAKQKKQAAIDELTQQIARLKKEAAFVPGIQSSIAQLENILEELTLPPVLPRVNKQDLANIRASIQQASQPMAEMLANRQTAVIGLSDEQKDKLSTLQDKVNSPDIDNKLSDAFDFIKDSYLTGAHFINRARSPHPQQEHKKVHSLVNALNEQLPLTDYDYAFCTIKGLSFKQISLVAAYFEFSNLESLVFEQTDLRFVNFANSKLKHSFFTACLMTSVNLGAGVYDSCHFNQIQFDEVTFAKSVFRQCTFTECTFSERQDAWLETQLIGCRFVHCTLKKQQFIELNSPECEFIECDLTESNFIKPILSHSMFKQCCLDSVNVVMGQLDNVSFTQSMLTNTRFVGGCQMQHCNFNGATVHGSNLRECDLTATTFVQSDVSSSDFGGSLLNHVNFHHSIAKQSQFCETKLRQCNFTKADLFEANLMNADLRDSRFNNANMYNVNFLNATVAKTDFGGANLEKTLFENWRPIFE
ncbi:hypothetical protein PULV_b0826 [Pseudoalteromonas ulvae UL12]|uniref:DUF2169 family type VI secretion system accessory protein n=1 Tax=Pseudoalteromonas ulvae TaxID=107327 RepID=UPI00186B6D2F|nr:pentapeptide repeat-containing protein [Pseudoalteromonas ulvae]MBE0366087.1 hypothetical protein [Pseudoalteromonas ulvae UL12]